MSGGSSVLWCLPASIPLQGDSVSSVGFYGCVGGVSLLQSLAGGQCFIGSVFVSMSGRYGGNMAMWLGVSLRPCFYSLQVIKR